MGENANSLEQVGIDRSLTPFIMLPAAQKILRFIRTPFFQHYHPTDLSLNIPSLGPREKRVHSGDWEIDRPPVLYALA